jgi:hypothetical protein
MQKNQYIKLKRRLELYLFDENSNFVAKDPLLSGRSEQKKDLKNSDDMLIGPQAFTLMGKKFIPPPLSLLELDKGKPGVGDIKANANIRKISVSKRGTIPVFRLMTFLLSYVKCGTRLPSGFSI